VVGKGRPQTVNSLSGQTIKTSSATLPAFPREEYSLHHAGAENEPDPRKIEYRRRDEKRPVRLWEDNRCRGIGVCTPDRKLPHFTNSATLNLRSVKGRVTKISCAQHDKGKENGNCPRTAQLTSPPYYARSKSWYPFVLDGTKG
jgi:hypothetical protein